MTVSQLAPVLDEPLPQAPDSESALIGAVLINNHAFWRVLPIIQTADVFFHDGRRATFAAMIALAERSEPIERITLIEELRKRGDLELAGGQQRIAAYLDDIPNIANIETYAEIVKEKAALRSLIVMGNRTLRAAADPAADTKEVLADAEKLLYAIAEGATNKGFATLHAITRKNMSAIETLHTSAGRLVTGIPTGYDRFNEFTSGFQPSEFIILAARPSMGKSAMMMNIAEAIALPGKDGNPRSGERLYSVGVFSQEMSKEQLGLRTLSSESGVSNHLIRSGMLSERNWSDLAQAASRVAKGRIFIDDTPGLDPLELRAKARRLKHEAELDIVMLDYIQLMSVKGKTESRQQEVSQISRGLKATAMELKVPLIGLSQLSRRPEQRAGDHRPQLSDLRETGSLEQDADLVCFIYRDEVYNRETEEKGIAEIIIAKNRNGPIGDFRLVFRADITKFYNYQSEPDYVPSGGGLYRE